MKANNKTDEKTTVAPNTDVEGTNQNQTATAETKANANTGTVVVISNENLRKLYNENPVAKCFLENCKRKQFLHPLTTVEDMQKALLNAKIMPVRSEIIATSKELEALGCGKFVSGRRGRVSRFEWVVDTHTLGRAAAGENVEVSYTKAPEPVHTSKTTEGQIKHNYQLRPDFKAALVLPIDLTRSEARRIGEFVSTLPFETPAPAPVQKAA